MMKAGVQKVKVWPQKIKQKKSFRNRAIRQLDGGSNAGCT